MSYIPKDWKNQDIIQSNDLDNIENELGRLSGIIDSIVKISPNGIKFGDQKIITLDNENWKENNNNFIQEVVVNGITPINSVIIAPAANNYLEYGLYKIRCTNQDNNSLTFTAADKPDNNLQVNLLILPYINIVQEEEENAI